MNTRHTASPKFAGTRTAPYRLLPGAAHTLRKYCCRSVARRRHQKKGKDEAGGDEGDDDMHFEDGDMHVEDIDDESTTGVNAPHSQCKGMVVVQRCTVKQLITGTVRRCAAEARPHSRARLD